MEAVACERILALDELDPAHCRHDDDGAAHAAVGAGAAADRIEAVAERRLETHRAAMALAGPNVRVAHHVAVSRCCRLYVIPDRETKPVTRPSSIPRERSRSPDARSASGPQDLAFPDGQNTQTTRPSARAKIFHFTEIRL